MAAISWTQTPTLMKLTLPSGTSYYFKDDEVRTWIGDGATSGAEKRLSDAESAIALLSNATHWLGVTTTILSDGSTTNPITIDGQSVTAVSGDIVEDGAGTEYIFNGTSWQEFGKNIGTLKAFAYVDTGTVTLTPAGSVSTPTISVASAGTTGTVKEPSYSVSNEVLTITLTDKTVKTGDASYSSSQPSFTGTEAIHTVYPASLI